MSKAYLTEDEIITLTMAPGCLTGVRVRNEGITKEVIACDRGSRELAAKLRRFAKNAPAAKPER